LAIANLRADGFDFLVTARFDRRHHAGPAHRRLSTYWGGRGWDV